MTDRADKQYEYGEYAEHCLHTVRLMPNREARDLQRRMAAAWLKFAKALLAESTEQQP
jgi:formamidopyrimidine-DNA glycosylase